MDKQHLSRGHAALTHGWKNRRIMPTLVTTPRKTHVQLSCHLGLFSAVNTSCFAFR